MNISQTNESEGGELASPPVLPGPACRRCDGKGKYYLYFDFTKKGWWSQCTLCGGTGSVDAERRSDPGNTEGQTAETE